MTANAGLTVSMVAGQSAITEAWSANPLKLLMPRPRGPSVSAYLGSFGGGLVAGDQTNLTIRLGAGSRCFLTTQSSTKVYRNPEKKPCGHRLSACLEPGSFLVVAPDPVQSFADSAYDQAQHFSLQSGAGLVLLDWFCSGRAARGERWSFRSLRSKNEIFVDGQLRVLDSLLLDGARGPLAGAHRMGRFNCVALVVILGQCLAEQAASLLHCVESQPVDRLSNVIFSASPIRDGAVLRFAGENQEELSRHIHRSLGFMGRLLPDDPWNRKFRRN